MKNKAKNIMKKVVFFQWIVLLFCTSCAKKNDIILFQPNDDHRGVWGCGIPCGGTILPKDQVCNKPNGVCSLAQVMPAVTIFESMKTDMKVTLINEKVIRFIFPQPNYSENINGTNTGDDDKEIEKVIKILNDELASEKKPFIENIAKFILSNFSIPNDILYDEKSSKLLLENKNINGKKILVKQGEYRIQKTKKYPKGYCDIKIEIIN